MNSTHSFANWRALLPSWRLFDEIGPGFDMEYRFGSQPGSFTNWCNARPPVQARPWNLFFNPTQNLVHALDSLLERIVNEAQSLNQAEQRQFDHSVTYRLVQNWARECVRKRTQNAKTENLNFQFRICTRSIAPIGVDTIAPSQSEEILISLVHSL